MQANMCCAPRKPDAPEKPLGRLMAHVLHEDWFKWDKLTKAEFLKTEILLGITICFAQVPESVAFAFMAHIKPPVALHAAWVVGLICTLFGGRSGMVNGAEGAFAAIISTMVAVPEQPGQNGEGIELLFPSVMCAGAFMLVIWVVGGDRFITLMAASIMDGFCCGLAIVIGMSQLHPFQLGHGEDKSWRPFSDPTTSFMVLIMICSMLTMELVPKIPHKAAKLVPSSLLAILVACFIEFVIVRQVQCDPTKQVDLHMGGAHRRLAETNSTGLVRCETQVIGEVTPFTFTYPEPFFLNGDYLNGTGVYGVYNVGPSQAGTILIQGLLLAIAGVVQGLMTTEVVTSFVKTPAHTPSIVWSMGVANLLSGFLGGMGGDAMIGLSTINCLNGGKGRLAPTVTALGVMLCTMVAYPALNFIPISALAGVMIVVVLHTFKWAKVPMIISACLPQAWRKPINDSLCGCNAFPKWLRLPEEVDRWEALIIVVVSVLTILFNLVIGVGVGLVLACVRFTYAASLETNVVTVGPGVSLVAGEPSAGGTSKRYKLEGKLFFGSAMRFHTFFDVDNDPPDVTLELSTRPTEYSATDALARVAALYRAAGKTLTIEVLNADGGEEGTAGRAAPFPPVPPTPAIMEKEVELASAAE